MYYPYFIAYMAAGFIISIVVFFWALSHGQFKDQQRARFLPLEPGVDEKPVKPTRFAKIETWTMFVMACAGLATTAVVVLIMLLRSG